MTVLKEKINKRGKREVTLEVDTDAVVVILKPQHHYKLGYPLEDIVEGSHIAEAVPVVWDVVEQKWIN